MAASKITTIAPANKSTAIRLKNKFMIVEAIIAVTNELKTIVMSSKSTEIAAGKKSVTMVAITQVGSDPWASKSTPGAALNGDGRRMASQTHRRYASEFEGDSLM
jgi:hypothetical protein